MILNINLKEATNLIFSLPSDKVEYVENMVKLFENNAVAIKHRWGELETVEVESTITLGDSIEFKQNDSYSNPTSSDLNVSGKSGDVLEHWVELTPQVLANDKRLTEEYKKKIKKLEEDNKYLKTQIERLNEELEDIKNQES